MTKADELWEKYKFPSVKDVTVISKVEFLAALKEYGAMVRAEDVKVCRSKSGDAFADQLAAENTVDIDPSEIVMHEAAKNSADNCAAAIESKLKDLP